MENSAERRKLTKKFAADAMKRRPDAVGIEEIVYLDEDLHTYKYFMTGEFDESQRKKEIVAQQSYAQKMASDTNYNSNSSNEGSRDREKEA